MTDARPGGGRPDGQPASPAGHDGTPQPASAPMTKDEADRLVVRTHGQLQAFRAADGNWYVYETTQPAGPVRDRPR